MTGLQTSPTIKGIKVEEGRAELLIGLPAALLCFQGHFPGTAILPGIAQVHWAVSWGVELLGVHGAFAGMDQIKFFLPVRPGDELTLLLEWSEGKSLLIFKYALGGRTVSSGRVRFT